MIFKRFDGRLMLVYQQQKESQTDGINSLIRRHRRNAEDQKRILMRRGDAGTAGRLSGLNKLGRVASGKSDAFRD
jgi:hypothetical protein